MRNAIKWLWLLLLSSTAFSQPGTPVADTPYCQPLWQARKVAVDLLELDSLRSERSLLATRLQLLERYRQQAANRAVADSLTIAQQAQLIGVKNGQLAASKAMQLYHADRAKHYRRQRNVAIGVCAVISVTSYTLMIQCRNSP